MFKSFPFFTCALLPALSLSACAQTPPLTKLPSLEMTVRSNAQIPAPKEKEIYIPLADRAIDFTSKDSKYSNFRKAETPDIVLFWDKVYGDDPSKNPDPGKRFNVNEVLKETERYYDYYVNVLKFVEKGNSVTDKYKAIVYVTWNEGGDNGTAFGGGADKKIGVFWTPASRINKGPYGVIAHELGHSFQSLVGSDGNAGLRGPVWEMTSQYMLWQVLPEWMTFENYHLKDFMKRTHLAFLHEDNAYHSPYVLEYWSNKHGLDFVGKVWRQALQNEDMVMAYKRLTGLDQKAFNDEMFDASRHFITWDMVRIEKLAAPYANQHTSALDNIGDGWYRIAASRCPQNYGYNGIKLEVPAAGTKVTLDFKGIAGAEGFRAINVDKAGWRYGFVASKEDGSREYGQTYSASEDTAQFTVSAGTKYLWLVVSGAPTQHFEHISSKNHINDEQWPYQFKLSGTSPDASMLDVNQRDAAMEKAVAADFLLWQDSQRMAPLQAAMKAGDPRAVTKAFEVLQAQNTSAPLLETARIQIAAWQQDQKLAPLQAAMKANNLGAATKALEALQAQNASDLLLETARVQIAALTQTPRPVPAETNAETLFLSEAKPGVATVGWLQPTYNRLPDEDNSPFLMVGNQLFTRGIYAHAPARHVYNLGGKWGRFTGSVGVARAKPGRVGFKILADGQEIWKSKPLEGSALATFDLSVKDVQSLELLTDDGGNGTGSDWGLWLDPKLTK